MILKIVTYPKKCFTNNGKAVGYSFTSVGTCLTGFFNGKCDFMNDLFFNYYKFSTICHTFASKPPDIGFDFNTRSYYYASVI